MRNGYTPSKSNPAYWEGGTIPWFRMEDLRTSGRILEDSIQHITPAAVKGKGLFKAGSILMATTATIGEHALLIADSLANQQFTNFAIRESLMGVTTPMFAYYYFFLICEWCKRNVYESSFPSVDMKRLREVRFPIPPVVVQEEVVRVLDKFTALEAELDCRKRQYGYYRDALLTFDLSPSDGLCHSPLFPAPFTVEWLPLGEVGEYSQSKVKNSELSEDSFIGVDNLLPDRKGKTSSSYVPTKGLSTRYQVDDVLIGNIRPYLKKIYLADNNGGASGDVLVVHVTSDTISPKYLYQVLADDKFFSYNMRYAKGAKMPRGSKDKIMSYPIPIPPLEVQERIVEILDKFDTLVNSISEGLPREIELRRKQYEYYRDALLSF